MKYVLRREWESWIRVEGGPCASIYLPLNPTGREGMGDPLRLTKLAQEVESQLSARGFEERRIQSLLAPVYALPNSPRWTSRGRSMALLLGPSTSNFLSLDATLASEGWGDDHLHVRPLLPLVIESDRFFVLALSENHVHLYEGDAEQLRQIEVPGLPKNMDEALQLEDVDRGTQTHSANAGGRGRKGAVFHGHGGKSDAEKAGRREYFRQIAAMIEPSLVPRAPLVLATVAENVPLWQELSSNSHALDDFVAGNPDYTSLGDLHRAAWQIIEGGLHHERDSSYEHLANAKGTTRALIGLAEILPAAAAGCVDTLFVDCRAPVYGQFDRARQEVITQSSEKSRGDSDLVELAIRETLQHRGKVFPLAVADNLPSVAEALVRY